MLKYGVVFMNGFVCRMPPDGIMTIHVSRKEFPDFEDSQHARNNSIMDVAVPAVVKVLQWWH